MKILHPTKTLFTSIIIITLTNRRIINMIPTKESPLWCYFRSNNYSSHEDLVPELQELETTERPYIFFIETTCQSRLADRVILSQSQSCAIESAAKMNPQADIYVLVISQSGIDIVQPNRTLWVHKLLEYPNIYFRRINFKQYLEETPLDDWPEITRVFYSKYPEYHANDILKYITLWKYGGTYLDLDVIVLDSLYMLGQNFAGAENKNQVGVSVLNFQPTGIGRTFLEKVLDIYRNRYNPLVPISDNGQQILTDMFKRVCQYDKVTDIVRKRCGYLRLYPYTKFYIYGGNQWRLFFDERSSSTVIDRIYSAGTKIVHFYNSVNPERNLYVRPKSPYNLLAQQYCPKVQSV